MSFSSIILIFACLLQSAFSEHLLNEGVGSVLLGGLLDLLPWAVQTISTLSRQIDRYWRINFRNLENTLMSVVKSYDFICLAKFETLQTLVKRLPVSSKRLTGSTVSSLVAFHERAIKKINTNGRVIPSTRAAPTAAPVNSTTKIDRAAVAVSRLLPPKAVIRVGKPAPASVPVLPPAMNPALAGFAKALASAGAGTNLKKPCLGRPPLGPRPPVIMNGIEAQERPPVFKAVKAGHKKRKVVL